MRSNYRVVKPKSSLVTFVRKLRRSPRKLILFVFVLGFAGIGVYYLVRSKAAIPTGTYTNWDWPEAGTGYWSIEHGLSIEDVTPDATYFWSHQFQIVGGDGGYIGLQSHGNSISGQVGKTAVFSIFGTGIWGTPGNCETTQAGFDGGLYGAGTSCRIPFDWQIGHNYGLKAGVTGGDASGVIWTGTIADYTTGQVTTIAQIKVPTSWKGIGFWSSMWTEYFGGQPATCDKLAYSRVKFARPTVNGVIAPKNKNNSYAPAGQCISKITDTADGGVVQEMGTPQPGPKVNNPYGWVDEASCDYIGGWAKDDDSPNSAVDVHLYFEQPLGAAGSVGWNLGPANQVSSDVGYHRFRRNLRTSNPPINFYDGTVHKVYAYAINIGATGANAALSMNTTPLSIGPCAAPNTPATPPPSTPPPATNAAPTVTLNAKSPQIAPANFSLTATASDSNGIANIAMYRMNPADVTSDITIQTIKAKGTLLSTDTSSPYLYTETNRPAGTYIYFAIATDKGSTPASGKSSKVSVTVNPAPVVVAADANGDKKVDVFDLNAVLSNWRRTNVTLAQGDLNNDDVVNVFDLALVLNNWTFEKQ